MTTAQESLQHLIGDPELGFLYPHSRATAAFGLTKVYHLNRLRQQLQEGKHWHKVKCQDNIWRIFYTLQGLQTLSEMIATPEAKDFWEALRQQAKNQTAMIRAMPASLFLEPEPSEEHLPNAPFQVPPPGVSDLAGVPSATYQEPFNVPSPPQVQRRDAELVSSSAGAVTPHNSSLATYPGSQVVAGIPAEVAIELMFRAQEMTARHITNAISAQPQPTVNIHQEVVESNDQGLSQWLAKQDSVALTIFYSFLLLLFGFGLWLMLASPRQPSPNPAQQSFTSTALQ